MKHDQPNTGELNSQDPKVSEKRRRLLQASAASASLIGTLPSGAALANISAYQCLQNDEARDPTPQLLGSARNPPPGGWLEIKGLRVTYTGEYTTSADPPNPPTQPTCSDSPMIGFRFDGTDYIADGSEEYLASAGKITDTSSCPPSEGDWTLTWTESTEEWYALYYFEHLDDYTDLSAGPSLLNQPSAGNNWIALTGSCWSSLGGTG